MDYKLSPFFHSNFQHSLRKIGWNACSLPWQLVYGQFMMKARQKNQSLLQKDVEVLCKLSSITCKYHYGWGSFIIQGKTSLKKWYTDPLHSLNIWTISYFLPLIIAYHNSPQRSSSKITKSHNLKGWKTLITSPHKTSSINVSPLIIETRNKLVNSSIHLLNIR